jgi:CRISPR-associated protein Cas1
MVMIPRILEIAESCRYIAKQRGSIIIKDSTGSLGNFPIADIGIMMVSAYGATFTKDVLVSLAEQGSITILCDNHSLPAAIVTPVVANYETPLRVKLQLGASVPLKKRLWQAIITRKLINQGQLLHSIGNETAAKRLFTISKEVQSGDSDNREAVGARFYWKNLFGENFKREKEGSWPNSALNYGYTILRSAVVRAIYGSGLLPLFSIHHENSKNPFPLADDLMEPYRPIVDYLVYKKVYNRVDELNTQVKQIISKVLWADLVYEGKITPLYQALEQLCFSLVASYKAKKCLLEISELRFENDDS